MNKLLNKKTAIELKFAKSFGQKAKNCTVRREEKGIRGRPKGREKRVGKDKIEQKVNKTKVKFEGDHTNQCVK